MGGLWRRSFFVNNVKKYVDVDLESRFECSIHGKQTVIVKPFDSDSKRKVMQTQIIMVLEANNDIQTTTQKAKDHTTPIKKGYQMANQEP
jgi:hypothetical protein